MYCTVAPGDDIHNCDKGSKNKHFGGNNPPPQPKHLGVWIQWSVLNDRDYQKQWLKLNCWQKDALISQCTNQQPVIVRLSKAIGMSSQNVPGSVKESLVLLKWSKHNYRYVTFSDFLNFQSNLWQFFKNPYPWLTNSFDSNFIYSRWYEKNTEAIQQWGLEGRGVPQPQHIC